MADPPQSMACKNHPGPVPFVKALKSSSRIRVKEMQINRKYHLNLKASESQCLHPYRSKIPAAWGGELQSEIERTPPGQAPGEASTYPYLFPGRSTIPFCQKQGVLIYVIMAFISTEKINLAYLLIF
jgi:hypothetical protein